MRSGIPWSIDGKGSLTTVTCAVLGSMRIAWRTTTVPRLKGPAIAGTTTASPYGPALYGPVRNTLPGRKNGVAPGPAPVWTLPTCESAGQLPAAASASEQSGTPASLASKPGGSVTLRLEKYWSVSERENESTNGVNAPAWRLLTPAVKAGWNPLTHPLSIANVSDGLAAAPPFQGVRDVVVVYDPLDSGV